MGVDPHRDSHALAIVHVLSGAIVFEANVAANSEGYAQALELVERHTAALLPVFSASARSIRLTS